MMTDTKIKFTLHRNLLDILERHYETSTHRYITFQRDGWWVTDIYLLERVGTLDPPLMVRGKHVDYLLNVTLEEARTEIAEKVKSPEKS